MLKVAVTGGLSCGKSTVCRLFAALGAHVVSADSVVHRLFSDPAIRRDVVALLGDDILVNGGVDRARVAAKVFADLQLLAALEGILHPAVATAVEREFQRVQQATPRPLLFVAEIPLLFESGTDSLYDATIAVVADDASCIARFAKATGNDAAEYRRRMARQLTPSEKAARATYVVHNEGSEESLAAEVKALFERLTGTMDNSGPK